MKEHQIIARKALLSDETQRIMAECHNSSTGMAAMLKTIEKMDARTEYLAEEVEDAVAEELRVAVEEAEQKGWDNALDQLDTYVSNLFAAETKAEMSEAIKALEKVHSRMLAES